MNKQTIHFDIELFQGYTCGGCAVLDDLTLEVEFTEKEIALMRQLVSQIDEDLYSEGIMPVLKDGAPDLYDRMESAARKEIFDFYVSEGISRAYIEFEEDELLANFRKDNGLSDDEEIDEDAYDEWYDEEMERIHSNGLEWVRSRYSVDDQVCMEDDASDYTIDIPSEFL